MAYYNECRHNEQEESIDDCDKKVTSVQDPKVMIDDETQ
jgi:hypothetical protein